MPPQTISQYFSGMPDLSDNSTLPADPILSDWENKVLHIVKSRWPTSSLEIAEFLGLECVTRNQKRLLSSRVVYHVKKLVDKKRVISKRFGNALIVWPFEVETLRVMHEMMNTPSLANHSAHSSLHRKNIAFEKKFPAKILSTIHPVKRKVWKEEV